MNSYADTSFIVPLYLVERHSATAAAVFRQIEPPVLVSPLGELEFRNALQLARFRRQITDPVRLGAWQQWQADVAEGLFTLAELPSAALYAKAAELADRHSASLGTRTLDLLHVAAALLLGADELLSFDTRQNAAASAEGLRVRP